MGVASAVKQITLPSVSSPSTTNCVDQMNNEMDDSSRHKRKKRFPAPRLEAMIVAASKLKKKRETKKKPNDTVAAKLTPSPADNDHTAEDGKAQLTESYGDRKTDNDEVN